MAHADGTSISPALCLLDGCRSTCVTMALMTPPLLTTPARVVGCPWRAAYIAPARPNNCPTLQEAQDELSPHFQIQNGIRMEWP